MSTLPDPCRYWFEVVRDDDPFDNRLMLGAVDSDFARDQATVNWMRDERRVLSVDVHTHGWNESVSWVVVFRVQGPVCGKEGSPIRGAHQRPG